jgi:hypothetical protein
VGPPPNFAGKKHSEHGGTARPIPKRVWDLNSLSCFEISSLFRFRFSGEERVGPDLNWRPSALASTRLFSSVIDITSRVTYGGM